MRNITHTSWKNKMVKGFIAPMSLGLLLTGCVHQPVVKPITGVSPQQPQEEAVAYCKATTTLSLKAKLDLVNQTRDPFGDAGQEAGLVSDVITKDEESTGAKTGKNAGKTFGTIVAFGALYQDAKAEDQRFQVCMHKKGYMVIAS